MARLRHNSFCLTVTVFTFTFSGRNRIRAAENDFRTVGEIDQMAMPLLIQSLKPWIDFPNLSRGHATEIPQFYRCVERHHHLSPVTLSKLVPDLFLSQQSQCHMGCSRHQYHTSHFSEEIFRTFVCIIPLIF
jgi:hypothetical protein